MDPLLTEALARLDRWLIEVIGREERRAERLTAPNASGWAGVRALARPSFAELVFDETEPPGLIPQGDHPLSRAADRFALPAPLAEALLLLLAPHLEPRYRALYGILQDDASAAGATERLLLTVLGRTPDRRRILYEALTDTGKLVGAGLVVPVAGTYAPMGRPVDLAPEVRAALLGLAPPAGLADNAIEWVPGESLAATDSRPTLAPACAVIFGRGEWLPVAARMAPDAAGLLVGPAPDDKAAALRMALALWRAATLHAAVAVVDLTDLQVDVDRSVAAELFRHVTRHGGRALVRSRQELALAVPHLEAAPPSFAERRRGWSEQAAERAIELPDDVLDRLAAASHLGPSEIRRAIDGASGPSESALSAAAARFSHVPIRHGVRVVTQRSLEDLIVRDSTRESLERLIYFTRNRDRVVEARALSSAVGGRRGPLVLFSGLSGTGKTLAAEVVANALARSLYVVDLSQLVSKYIGETEKHIDQVLSEAERAGVVLFFDEADAMFAARTEQVSNANDRFANLGVGFLLQRVERHDGVVILATNLRHAIDQAFLRRFHFRIEFPFPETEERRQIWERMLPSNIRREGDLDLRALAQRHRLSGGEIRNVALKAVFLAEKAGVPLGREILEQAVSLELLELGRLARIERRESGPGGTDSGALLRRFTESLEAMVADQVRHRFSKEIHLVHGPPTREALSGRRPAISVALYRVAAPRTGGLRLGFVISAWSHRTEDEHELLGAVHDILSVGSLRAPKGKKITIRVQESYDFDLLHRFWSSHGHPMRASIVLDAELV